MKKINLELKLILEEFNKHNVQYALLRNYDFLLKDEIYSGGDVDILVSGKDIRKINEIIVKNSFNKRTLNPFSGHCGYQKIVPEDFKVLKLHFHIDGVTGRHVKYLDAKPILQRRKKTSFFYHTSKEDEFLVILLHSLLDAVEINERYEKELMKFHNLDYNYIRNSLSNVFSKKISGSMMAYIEKKNFKSLSSLASLSKGQFESSHILKIAKVYSFGVVWKLFHQKLAPVVCLIGMDGTGKTTNINNIHEVLSRSKVKHEVIYGGRGRSNVLPIQFAGKVYKIINGGNKAKKLSTSDLSSKEFKSSFVQKIIYSAAAPVFALDLFLRYWFKIFPKRFRNEVIVVDRYSSDILLMYHVPVILKRLLYIFLPKATKSIYLYNDPEVLFRRKKNHPLADLIRQEKIFDEINKYLKPIKIKSEGLEETKRKVLHESLS